MWGVFICKGIFLRDSSIFDGVLVSAWESLSSFPASEKDIAEVFFSFHAPVFITYWIDSYILPLFIIPLILYVFKAKFKKVEFSQYMILYYLQWLNDFVLYSQIPALVILKLLWLLVTNTHCLNFDYIRNKLVYIWDLD